MFLTDSDKAKYEQILAEQAACGKIFPGRIFSDAVSPAEKLPSPLLGAAARYAKLSLANMWTRATGVS